MRKGPRDPEHENDFDRIPTRELVTDFIDLTRRRSSIKMTFLRPCFNVFAVALNFLWCYIFVSVVMELEFLARYFPCHPPETKISATMPHRPETHSTVLLRHTSLEFPRYRRAFSSASNDPNAHFLIIVDWICTRGMRPRSRLIYTKGKGRAYYILARSACRFRCACRVCS